MNINSNHLVGFAAGIVAAAGGFYLYKKNQARVDGWLRDQGIRVPSRTSADPESMSLEELVTEKERFEDIIAAREMEEAAGTAVQE
jgi:hypothetical protein